MQTSSYCWRSVGRGWEDMKGYLPMMNHTNCMDLWMVGKSAWGLTPIAWIYEARQECMRPSAGQDRLCILYNEMMSIYPGVSETYSACRCVHLRYSCISVCIYIERLRLSMPYYDVANLVTVTKTNMTDEMPSAYGTLRTTGVRIRHQVSRRPAQRSQQLHNLTIRIVKSRIILNAPPSLQVLSGACENPVAQSESTLQSSRGGWEHLKVLRSTGEGYQSVWEVCVWLPHQITFCWYAHVHLEFLR